MKNADAHTLKVTYGSDGKVRRENMLVLSADRKSISETDVTQCAFGLEDDGYAAQVVDGVGTDRMAHVSDEMWAFLIGEHVFALARMPHFWR